MFCSYRQLRTGAQCNAFQHAVIVFTIVHQLPSSSASPHFLKSLTCLIRLRGYSNKCVTTERKNPGGYITTKLYIFFLICL